MKKYWTCSVFNKQESQIISQKDQSRRKYVSLKYKYLNSIRSRMSYCLERSSSTILYSTDPTSPEIPSPECISWKPEYNCDIWLLTFSSTLTPGYNGKLGLNILSTVNSGSFQVPDLLWTAKVLDNSNYELCYIKWSKFEISKVYTIRLQRYRD